MHLMSMAATPEQADLPPKIAHTASQPMTCCQLEFQWHNDALRCEKVLFKKDGFRIGQSDMFICFELHQSYWFKHTDPQTDRQKQCKIKDKWTIIKQPFAHFLLQGKHINLDCIKLINLLVNFVQSRYPRAHYLTSFIIKQYQHTIFIQ